MYDKVQDHGGERLTFAGGGERESSSGKGRYDLLPPEAIRRLARHYEAGSRKYLERNWEKGLPLSRFTDSALRHLFQFMDGDRTEDHLAAAMWNIAGYIQTEYAMNIGRLPRDFQDVPWEESDPPSKVIEPEVLPPKTRKR